MTGQGWACAALCAAVVLFAAGRAYQRIRDGWTAYGDHRRATPVIRRRAIRITADGFKILLLALGIVAVAIAFAVTKK